jgi:hypothetical protein
MSVIVDIFEEKCPKCSHGKVFSKKGNPLLFRMPRMNDHCPNCGHKFEKETGYFFGSMYVSYALAVAEMVAVFIIVQFFVRDFVPVISIIALMAFLLSTFNFRLSRMIWIYMLDGKGRSV